MKPIFENEIRALLNNCAKYENGKITVTDKQAFRKLAPHLAEVSALGGEEEKGLARFIIRSAALDLGIYPASIHELYMGKGKGIVPVNFSVPAINLRIMAYDAAKAVFRSALKMNGAAFIFEIARSEMGYTDQKPAEYASSILAAAIAEGYQGPVFIQGDHFQVSQKKYQANPDVEIKGLKKLIDDAIAAGFFNIDIDTSTLVDLSKTSIKEQQTLNVSISALLAEYIRLHEPKGVTISIGGEIGEVGGHNSTEPELRVYLDGFLEHLNVLKSGLIGLSKISVQTGTSHGGVVLADGTIAKVSVDFDTLRNLSRISCKNYGLGGTVQHGASTLSEDAFGKFAENEACEVHLATNFANIFFDLIPVELKNEMYAFLREKYSAERKPDMTEEQFYYKIRKNVIGPFKAKSWKLKKEAKAKITNSWEAQFSRLFTQLGVKDTRSYVDKLITNAKIEPKLADYIDTIATDSETKDLAD